jgi:hypothetical protein
MNTRLVWTIALGLGGAMLSGGVTASPSATGFSPDNPLQKSRGQWTLEGKTFRLADGEMISLYGVTRRRFITEQWYWGEAVSNLQSNVVEQRETDRGQNDRLRAIENNRSLEMQIADLKNEVVRLSTLIENDSNSKRKR